MPRRRARTGGRRAIGSLGGHGRAFHERSATLLLCLLLLLDAIGIALHLLVWLPDRALPLFSLERDGSYSEVFEYVKLLWLAVLLAVLARRQRSWSYLPAALLVLYMLADDAMGLHEGLGETMVQLFDFQAGFGLRAKDFGELAVSVAAGLVFLPLLLLGYWRAAPAVRRTLLDFALLLAVLVFFAVGVDMLHSMTGPSGSLYRAVGVLEDGGELVTMSVMVWYAFLTAVRPAPPQRFLIDCLRRSPR